MSLGQLHGDSSFYSYEEPANLSATLPRLLVAKLPENLPSALSCTAGWGGLGGKERRETLENTTMVRLNTRLTDLSF